MLDDPPQVELYMRSLAPTDVRDEQERIVGTLQSLDAAGKIADVEFTLCGDCVCPSLNTAETDTAKFLLRRFESFQQWAEANGRTLVGFEERDTQSLLTGTTVTGIVFPRITLAEYRDGRLTFVAPSSNGSEQTTVSERLAEYGTVLPDTVSKPLTDK
jgi:hypothetical protein